MGLDSPFGDEKQYFVADDVKEWSERDIEKFLKNTSAMSRGAAKALAARLDAKEKRVDKIHNPFRVNDL